MVSESACTHKIVPEQVIKLAMCHSLFISDLAGGEWFLMNDHKEK